MAKKIPLTHGKFATVDDDDYNFLMRWKWMVNAGGYASRSPTAAPGCRRKTVLMHRVINKTPDGMVTDHINRNQLDNRKKNLRSATHRQNVMNKKARENTSSIYKGVHRLKATGRWQSYIRVDGVLCHLGTFKSEKLAAYAYNQAAKKHFGEFAMLNKIT